MVHEALSTLLAWVRVFQPALTRPGFSNMIVVFAGWVLTAGPHAVTQALVMTGVAGRRHHEAFHRFFSRGTWEPDALGRLLFDHAVAMFVRVDCPIRIAVDDTLTPKKGPHVFGIGSHLDPVRSTRRFRVFAFGHCWVVLALLLPMPFCDRTWALPLLFRLYRNKKECEKKKASYRKKTELAREMLDVFATWVGGRRVELAADSAYCNDTVTRRLPTNILLFGAMRPDAVLTALPRRRKRMGGRPSKRGQLLAKPEALARDSRCPWETCRAVLYGKTRTVRYKTLVGQWYRACGVQLLRVVVVKVSEGIIGIRVFFSTDATLPVPRILETYAGRWEIESCFRNMKQLLGFADSSARKKAAVERTAPFVGYIYSTLVLWFAAGAYRSPLAAPPLRPWYSHKRGFSFADVLRAAQRALGPLDVLDPRRSLDNLRKPQPTAHPRRKQRLRLAA